MSNTQNNGAAQGTEIMNIVSKYVLPFLKAVGKSLKFLGRAFLNFIKKYFKVGNEKRTLSQSIELLAKVVYWFHLIIGFLGALGAWFGAIMFLIDGIAYFDFLEGLLYLILMIGGGFVSMLLSKFVGWISTIFLRAIAVVVASHEKHLRESEAAPTQPLTEASVAAESPAE